MTVAKAAGNWITYVELEDRERTTIGQYRQHVRHHIVPRISVEKLATLTALRVNALRASSRA